MNKALRITRIISLIGKIWYSNPNLRLTQIIMNALEINGDPYYIEDDHLEKCLEKYLKVLEGKSWK